MPFTFQAYLNWVTIHLRAKGDGEVVQAGTTSLLQGNYFRQSCYNFFGNAQALIYLGGMESLILLKKKKKAME